MSNQTCLLGKPCRVQSVSDNIITCITPKQPMETVNATAYPGKTRACPRAFDVTVGCDAWLRSAPITLYSVSLFQSVWLSQRAHLHHQWFNHLFECQTESCVVFVSSDCGGCYAGRVTLSQDCSVLDPSGLGSSVLYVLSQRKECFWSKIVSWSKIVGKLDIRLMLCNMLMWRLCCREKNEVCICG